MSNSDRSAEACARLLMQLSGVKLVPDLELPVEKGIDPVLRFLGQMHKVKFRRRRISYHKLRGKSLPLAFRDPHGDFILLAKIDATRALIQHPFKPNSEVWTLEELQNNWRGEVIVMFAPTLKFNLMWFIPAFWSHRRLLGEVLLFSLVLQLLALVSPLFFQIIMDKVLVHQNIKTLDILILGTLITALFEVIIRGLREYEYTHTANRIDMVLGERLVRHLLALPLIYFKNRQVGALVARVRELDGIREFLSGSLFTLVVDILFMSIFFVVMWLFSPALTGIFMLSIPFYILTAWRVTRPLQSRLETQFRHNAINTAFLTETIAGSETIKSLAVEPRLMQRWEGQTRDLVESGYRTQLLSSLSTHAVQAISKLTTVLILWYGAHAVINQRITLGQLIAFNMMANHLSGPLSRLVELWGKFVQAQVSIDKLGDILNMPTEKGAEGVEERLKGEIQLKDINFSYQPGAPLVLKRTSMHIKPGEHVGIVGESGSGKSTLARLLLRLYLPERGLILFDGQPLDSFNVHCLRKQVAVVLQENFLFNKSVRDNIAQAFPQSSLAEVIEAANLAGAHEFILQLPTGYDTVLAEGGGSLSGGQRQRIAIARALLINPSILIFDEATSALDDESQAVIQRNMSKIAAGRTVITIAHRLSTVRNCDRIMVLQSGQFIEQGDHEVLLQLGGKYAHLWSLQRDLKQEAG